MKFLGIALISLFSSAALANDGGLVGVDVNDLKIEMVERQGENVSRQPLDLKESQSIEMTFSGNVAELMKYLPGSRSVNKNYGKHFRTLAIAANEGYLIFNCENADLSFDQKGRPVYTPKPATCTVSMSKYETPVSDDLKHDLFGDWQDLKVPRACRMK